MSSQLDRKHERFVFSAALALRKYIKDLRKLVSEGEPPEASGIAGSPAALPGGEAEAFINKLNGIEQIIDEFIGKFNPRVENEPSLSLTYIWINIILGKMEDIVENMNPQSLKKTRGEMPREFETYLDNRVKTLLSLIRELRSTYTTDVNRKTQLLQR
ncbi:MAG: hypothetical protein FGF52_03520 [Candidatus Brockarchaeota archaeon]|nr:hypothetical protein [Candidatus Brockarchaeota archaeon]